MKLRNKDHDITVIERHPAGVTYGWGVVFWADILDNLYNSDPKSAEEIRNSSVLWDNPLRSRIVNDQNQETRWRML